MTTARETVSQHTAIAQRTGYPCTWTTPCRERCACVVPHSSLACLRCCRYGSDEQRQARAEIIARQLDSHAALLAALVDLAERAEQINEDTGELDAPPFSAGLLANARAAIEAAIAQVETAPVDR